MHNTGGNLSGFPPFSATPGGELQGPGSTPATGQPTPDYQQQQQQQHVTPEALGSNSVAAGGRVSGVAMEMCRCV